MLFAQGEADLETVLVNLAWQRGIAYLELDCGAAVERALELDDGWTGRIWCDDRTVSARAHSERTSDER